MEGRMTTGVGSESAEHVDLTLVEDIRQLKNAIKDIQRQSRKIIEWQDSATVFMAAATKCLNAVNQCLESWEKQAGVDS